MADVGVTQPCSRCEALRASAERTAVGTSTVFERAAGTDADAMPPHWVHRRALLSRSFHGGGGQVRDRGRDPRQGLAPTAPAEAAWGRRQSCDRQSTPPRLSHLGTRDGSGRSASRVDSAANGADYGDASHASSSSARWPTDRACVRWIMISANARRCAGAIEAPRSPESPREWAPFTRDRRC